MIQVYKIMKGIDRISEDIFFMRSPCASTRGHSLKLAKPAIMKTPRFHSFSVRIVNDWNGPLEAAVNAESVNVLKNEVDRHWRKDMFILPP
jgi:ribonuclease P/MRP protein subunit RPP40